MEKTLPNLILREYRLDFKTPVRTSRGSLKNKISYMLVYHPITQPHYDEVDDYQIGEANFLPGLTIDEPKSYSANIPLLEKILLGQESYNSTTTLFQQNPSLLNAYEMLTHSSYHQPPVSQNIALEYQQFLDGRIGIPINGLVWMGDYEFQKKQIQKLFFQGFTTIKIKIGNLSLVDELQLIEFTIEQGNKILQHPPIIRLDANGAFPIHDALNQLQQLAHFPIHSIEQPLPKISLSLNNHERFQQRQRHLEVIQKSPIPIALDEELIGIHDLGEKEQLLEELQPHHLILKPGLMGGFSHCQEWIQLAKKNRIGWWITSALESNVGLTNITAWTCQMLLQHPLSKSGNNENQKLPSTNIIQTALPQGLGTGGLYQNNFSSPLKIKEGKLFFHQNLLEKFKRDVLEKLKIL